MILLYLKQKMDKRQLKFIHNKLISFISSLLLWIVKCQFLMDMKQQKL